MNATVENQMRAEVARHLPAVIEKAMKSYESFLEQSGQEKKETEDFKKYHEACKVALAHVALLIELAEWAGEGEEGFSETDLGTLIENAQKELKNHDKSGN